MNLKKIFQPAMALTFAFTLACTSCSTGPQLERDETAQATLDYKNNFEADARDLFQRG